MNRIEYDGVRISSRVDYWQKYWCSRVRDLMSPENRGSKINSPRFLLESIISDIKYLNSPNKEIWKVYKEILGGWEKNDIFSTYKNYCAFALKNWDQKPLLVSSICSQIIRNMDSGELFSIIIDKLSSVLSVDAVLSLSERKQVHLYTDILIGEFVYKGFELEDIEDMIHHPNVVIAETGDVIMAEEEVCGICLRNFPSHYEYETALTKYFQELTPREKVEILNLHFEAKGTPATVLIRLDGIKGPIDLSINDVMLYSVNGGSTDKRYITGDKELWIESAPDGQHLVNAAVPITHKSIKTTINRSIERVKEVLSMIQIWNRFQYPITINTSVITVILSQDNVITVGSPEKKYKTNPELKYLYSSNDASRYSKELSEYSDRITKLKRISTLEFTRLSNSAKWITSAKESTTAHNKLLFSWFAIESLIKLSEKYQKTIVQKAENGILDYVHSIIVPLINRNHFIHYRSAVINEFYNNSKIMQNRWNVPPGINDSLFETDRVNTEAFFKEFPKIFENITEESLVDSLIPFIEYYDKSGKGISCFKTHIKNELTYIYRLRNYIVHDAKLIDSQLPYYANRALFYASSLFNAILAISTSNDISLEDAIIKLFSDCDMFMIEIDKLLKSYSLNIK